MNKTLVDNDVYGIYPDGRRVHGHWQISIDNFVYETYGRICQKHREDV